MNQDRPGYQFKGFFMDEEGSRRLNPASLPDSKVELIPQYERVEFPITYNLPFGTNDPRNPDSVNVESGVIKLYDAVCAGYQFDGWYLGGRKIREIEEGVIAPLTLEGRFKPLSVVKFETGRGNRIADMTVSESGYLHNPPLPICIGHLFAGWHTDPEMRHPFNTLSRIEHDITLYANWKVEVFQLEFDANGGEILGEVPRSYTVLQPTFLLPQCRREGYRFLGWRDSRNNPVLMVRHGVIGHKKFTAQWQKNEPLVITCRDSQKTESSEPVIVAL